jgi:hypothetical protein
MRDISTKVDDSGDTLSASDFNALQVELETVVTSSDQILDPAGGPDVNLDQLSKGIAHYANSGSTYTDSGAANAYVITISSNLKKVSAYLDNMKITFKVGNTNTGASTVNINSLGAKSITRPDGVALGAGELIANAYATLIFNLSSTRFELIPIVPGISGEIKAMASSTVPSGWLECNGANANRTTYADLFAYIGVNYGNGDGSTTFTLPDFRGKFLRGWDNGAGNDPGAAGRLAQVAGGATGDNVGSVQADAMQKITGKFGLRGGSEVASGVLNVSPFISTAAVAASAVGNSLFIDFDNSTSTSPNAAKTNDFETTVINANAMYIIKT